MRSRTFIQVTALVLTLEAAFFLARSNLGLSADVIAGISTTKLTYSLHVVNSLSEQAANTWIGVGLLFIAISLQMWNLWRPIRWKDFTIDKPSVLGALIFCFFVLIGCYFLSNQFAEIIKDNAQQVLNAQDKSADVFNRDIISLAENDQKGIVMIWNLLTEYPLPFSAIATAIAAIGSFSAAFVAILLGYFIPKWRRPKLKIYFNENKKYPYFHKVAFKPFNPPITFNEQLIYFHRPGFNLRVKVYNYGESTAQEVHARIEKIEFFKEEKQFGIPRYYHPTTVKWSGEPNWKPVDIASKSHFF